jgi:hypothetical protein
MNLLHVLFGHGRRQPGTSPRQYAAGVLAAILVVTLWTGWQNRLAAQTPDLRGTDS